MSEVCLYISWPNNSFPYIIANKNHGKPLAAFGKIPSAIGKLMIGKILATAFEFQLKSRRQNNCRDGS